MGRKDQTSPPRSHTWKIIPGRKWLVTPIYEPFRPFGRANNLIKLINHGYQPNVNVLNQISTKVLFHQFSSNIHPVGLGRKELVS